MDSNIHVNISENIPNNCSIETTSFKILSTEMFAIAYVMCIFVIIKFCSVLVLNM